MIRTGTALVLVIVAFVLTACGNAEQESVTPAPSVPEPPPQAVAQAASAPARDIAAIEACELVTPAEVASIVGGSLASETSWTGPNCMYVIELGSGVESYQVSYQEPRMIEEMLKVMTPEEKGEPVAGAWDEAWFGTDATGNGFQVLAVRRGQLAISVDGERREPILEIARLAASRVE